MAVETNGPPTSAAAKILNGQNAQHLLDTLDAINAESFSSDGDRAKAVVSAYSLVSRLETPWESIARMCMGQVGCACEFLHLLFVQPLRIGRLINHFEASDRRSTENWEGSRSLREMA